MMLSHPVAWKIAVCLQYKYPSMNRVQFPSSAVLLGDCGYRLWKRWKKPHTIDSISTTDYKGGLFRVGVFFHLSRSVTVIPSLPNSVV